MILHQMIVISTATFCRIEIHVWIVQLIPMWYLILTTSILLALHLSTPILDRTPVTFGNSADCKITDQVFAYGFPSDSLNNKEENTVDDVSVVSGNISKDDSIALCGLY